MSATNITPDREVGQIVRDRPTTARVFTEYDIDYCCRGSRTVAEAATTAGVELDELREALAAVEPGEDAPQDWASTDELIDHIVAEHHDYLRAELPSLAQLVTKVRVVHGDAHPELGAVHRTFNALADELLTHMRDEEETVFPLIAILAADEHLGTDERQLLEEEILHMERDHEEAAANLDRLAELTGDFAIPPGACTRYENMLARLAELKTDTHRHVHKENNVLFRDAAAQLPESEDLTP